MHAVDVKHTYASNYFKIEIQQPMNLRKEMS